MADEPQHKTVMIQVPSPWGAGDDERTCRAVNEGLEKASEGGRWTLVGTELLTPRQSGNRRLLAVFRRGKCRDEN